MSALLNLHIDNEPMAASRRVVLDHAARLFRQYGYAAVSMRDIAAACGQLRLQAEKSFAQSQPLN